LVMSWVAGHEELLKVRVRVQHPVRLADKPWLKVLLTDLL